MVALRIELWVDGQAMGGVEGWWDGAEAALADSTESYPLLEGVSPYGEWRVPHDRVSELGGEARRLADAAKSVKTEELLSRLADLCTVASSNANAEIRFSGD